MTANRAELRHLVQGVETWSPPKEAPDDPFVYVDLSSVDRELKEITAPQGMTGAEAPSRARQLLKSGDVLVSTVRPNLNAVARVPGDLDGATGSTGFCVLRPDPDVLDSEYLFHWTRNPSFVAAMVRRATGASYPAVSDRIVKESKIPLPPLPEQRRIAAILDKADDVRRKRQQTLDLADQFLRSAFLDLFGDPVANPKGWPVKRLDEFAGIRSGITKGRKLGHAVTITVPYMRVANVQDGRLDLADIKTIEIRPDELEKYGLTIGDVLLTEGGDPDKLGRGAVWAGEVDPCVHQNHIFSVRADRSIGEPYFISALIGSAYGKRHFLRIGKQTTGIATINKTQLRGFPALVPPIEMQQKYAAIVARFERALSRLVCTLDAHEQLSNSLTQCAFRGEL